MEQGSVSSELIALVERLSRSAKGLVQEATDEHLKLLVDADVQQLADILKGQNGSEKTTGQLQKLKDFCLIEIERRAKMEEMDREFHAGEGAEDVVDPFSAKSASNKGIDYDKLIRRFGSKVERNEKKKKKKKKNPSFFAYCGLLQPVTPELVARLEKLTGHAAHRWIRRGYFFSHRAFDEILDAFEKKEPFYLYTGRGLEQKEVSGF
jgi:hypothetical protein